MTVQVITNLLDNFMKNHEVILTQKNDYFRIILILIVIKILFFSDDSFYKLKITTQIPYYEYLN